MNTKVDLTKWLVLEIILILVVSISGCSEVPASLSKNIQGKIENPKEPAVSKPDNFLYCEKDEDCTTTSFIENSCCLSCGHTINIQGKSYLEEWNKLNCRESSTFRDCLLIECCGAHAAKCVNNQCEGIYNC